MVVILCVSVNQCKHVWTAPRLGPDLKTDFVACKTRLHCAYLLLARPVTPLVALDKSKSGRLSLDKFIIFLSCDCYDQQPPRLE
jgi:hypothetical protein